MKLVPESEIERAKSDVSERLQKMKDLLQRVGVGGELYQSSERTSANLQDKKPRAKSQLLPAKPSEGSRPTETFRGEMSATTSTAILTGESLPTQAEDGAGRREPTQNPVPSLNSSVQAAVHAPASKPPSQPRARKPCVDAGTDPLDSLMDSNSIERLAAPTPSRRLGHEIETQTTLLPPAPVAMQASAPSSIANPPKDQVQVPALQRVSSTEGIQTEPEPQIDGDLIEKEMKEFLMQHLTKGNDDKFDIFTINNVAIDGDKNGEFEYRGNQEDPDLGELEMESPRIESIKVAEQRQPPNPHSRQGYRTFRMPTSRPNSSKAS